MLVDDSKEGLSVSTIIVTSDNDEECIKSLGDWLGGDGSAVSAPDNNISSRHCGQLILVVRSDIGTGISCVARHEGRINYLAM